jgi:type 1 glutamine amidotransferase
MASVTNNASVKDGNGLGPTTTVINIAKTNITKAEMTTMSTALQQAGHTIAGVKGMLADETADNVQVILQGGVTYVADASDALGVTGAATTILAGPFDQNPA